MRNHLKLLITALVSFAFFNCTNNSILQEQTQKIDSLLLETDKEQKILNEKIIEWKNAYQSQFELKIEESKNKIGDTLPLAFNQSVSNAMQSLKIVNTVELSRDSLTILCDKNKQQLTALKTDIKNKAYPNESITRFLETEKLNTLNLILEIRSAQERVNTEIISLNNTCKSLDSLIQLKK